MRGLIGGLIGAVAGFLLSITVMVAYGAATGPKGNGGGLGPAMAAAGLGRLYFNIVLPTCLVLGSSSERHWRSTRGNAERRDSPVEIGDFQTFSTGTIRNPQQTLLSNLPWACEVHGPLEVRAISVSRQASR
jgi:hypothetical protein